MPAESPMQTTARSPGARFRHSRPGRTKSPPFRGLVRRREKCRKGTKYRAMYRPRSRQPWRRGSDRTACGRIPPAWRESSRRTLPVQVAPVRALRRMAAQRRSLSPRQKAKCRQPAGHIVSGEVRSENPAGEPSQFRWRRSARYAEWLRKGAVYRRDKKQNAGNQQDILCQVKSRDLRQGQCTRSLFANWAPQAIVVFFSSAGISLSFLPSANVISRGNWTSSLHFGAPTSRAGFCLSKEKSTKIVGS